MSLLNRWLKKKNLNGIFNDIYQKNKWGGARGEYFSGVGSRGQYVLAYAEFVKTFVEINGINSVVDLGCGDFFVGQQICKNNNVKYVGVDVVKELVVHNQRKFGSSSISFQSLDIVSDEIPDGDLCLLRQVLQHLSNTQIECVLKKVKRYRYTLVTEHYPSQLENITSNKELVPGEKIRVHDHSAVFLNLPPFSEPNVKEVFCCDVLKEHCVMYPGETLRTFLLENY